MSRKKSYLLQLASLAILFVVWQLLSLKYHSILIPSPYETRQALVSLIETGVLVEQIITSMYRMIIGFLIGGSILLFVD